MSKKRTNQRIAGKREHFTEDVTAEFLNQEKINITFKRRPFDFTSKQKELITLIQHYENKIFFVSGVAGTSKTYTAVYSALKLIQDDDSYDEILYVRSAIESASKSMGFLPGDLDEKFGTYLIPLEDKIEELVTPDCAKFLKGSGLITPTPINFLRGSSWRNKIVLVDECQNLTNDELTTVLSRVGENTKLILTGDPSQSDINGHSGFQPMLNLFNDPESQKNGIVTFKFGEEDICRSEILKFIVKKLKEITK